MSNARFNHGLLMTPTNPMALVVDQDSDTAGYVGLHLEREFKFNIIRAKSVGVAIQLIDLYKPLLVISELSVAGESGVAIFDYIEDQNLEKTDFVLYLSDVDNLPANYREQFIVIEKPKISELLDAIQFLKTGASTSSSE